ncbi:PREDICTED: RALF [Prunus dulcis]|uniref:PREDICTED: RALF n=1 Tax=Prunus dulcis TaxID=3755 RepID=A0A5E4E184_PRUDU|nr:PREDICTED: RALF [Prunus dulcis]
MQRNTVPCSRRGASYYNCQPGAQSNPYSSGCSAITKVVLGGREARPQCRLYGQPGLRRFKDDLQGQARQCQ